MPSRFTDITFLALAVCLSALLHHAVSVEAQLVDRVLNQTRTVAQAPPHWSPYLFSQDEMNVRVPIFYDMTRTPNSLGINVLSGLVKVERGAEAERSGLVGSRPLSVRLFGVPIYERGLREKPLPESGLNGIFGGSNGDGNSGNNGGGGLLSFLPGILNSAGVGGSGGGALPDSGGNPEPTLAPLIRNP